MMMLGIRASFLDLSKSSTAWGWSWAPSDERPGRSAPKAASIAPSASQCAMPQRCGDTCRDVCMLGAFDSECVARLSRGGEVRRDRWGRRLCCPP